MLAIFYILKNNTHICVELVALKSLDLINVKSMELIISVPLKMKTSFLCILG